MSLHTLETEKPGGAVSRLMLALLICGACGAVLSAAPSFAQSQLSDTAVQQQIPPSFPSMIEEPPASPQAAPAATPEQKNAAAPAAGAKDAAAPASPVPAQPETKQLVPAKAMGKGVTQQQEEAPSSSAAEMSNPVEEAAARAEAAAEDKAPSDNMPDPLESYVTKTRSLKDTSEMSSGDALPKAPKLNMVKLEGDGFDNSAGRRVQIDVEDQTEGEPKKTAAELQDEIRREAFDAAITGMFPLNPDQIQGALKKYDQTQRAVKTPVYDDPKPEISVENISLDPGVVPPVIKTAVGNVTTLNILDATGAPWPVQDVTWAGDFEIVEPEEGGHIIRITPMSHFARGNIVIRMLTLKTPLTLRLETGRDVVQYRVDARIPEYGPFANAPIMQGGKSLVAGDSTLTSVLDGVPAGKMVKLQVSGTDGRTTAYSSGGMTYVRTPLTLLSPAWQSSVSSADGMNVYALANAPVVLLSDEGSFVRATLTEKEDLLDE